MWDINYDTFFEDCDEVFKDFLADYGFVDGGGMKKIMRNSIKVSIGFWKSICYQFFLG